MTCGGHGGEQVVLDLVDLFRRQVALLGSYSAPNRTVLEVVRLVADGVFRPVIHATLPLVEAARAHAMLADRQVFGKVVLVPS